MLSLLFAPILVIAQLASEAMATYTQTATVMSCGRRQLHCASHGSCAIPGRLQHHVDAHTALGMVFATCAGAITEALCVTGPTCVRPVRHLNHGGTYSQRHWTERVSSIADQEDVVRLLRGTHQGVLCQRSKLRSVGLQGIRLHVCSDSPPLRSVRNFNTYHKISSLQGGLHVLHNFNKVPSLHCRRFGCARLLCWSVACTAS